MELDKESNFRHIQKFFSWSSNTFSFTKSDASNNTRRSKYLKYLNLKTVGGYPWGNEEGPQQPSKGNQSPRQDP